MADPDRWSRHADYARFVHLRIRPAHPDDWPNVLAINRDCVPGVSRLDVTELARLSEKASYFRVAEERDRILGYCLAFAPTDDYDGEEFLWFRQRNPRVLYIDQIAIAESARRRRIGSNLYEDAVTFATNFGFGGLACEVNLKPPNPPSLRFHEQAGFGAVARLKTADGRAVSLQLLDLRRGRA